MPEPARDWNAHYATSGARVKELRSSFAHKVPELVREVIPPEYEDPLGIHAKADGQPAEQAASGSKAHKWRSRRRGKTSENIFRDFGKEHHKSALHEIEVGGIVIARANFKRFWKSDQDLGRWQEDLNDASRNTKLLEEVISRWQPGFRSDRADLVSKHCGPARQRLDSLGRASRVVARASTCVLQLRELHKQLVPEDTKPIKIKKFDFGKDFGSLLMGKKEGAGLQSLMDAASSTPRATRPEKDTVEPPSEAEEAVYRLLEVLLRNYSTLEEAFQKLDRNRNGILSVAEFSTSLQDLGFTEDHRFLYRLLEQDADGFISLKEFKHLRPYMLKALERHRIQVKPSRATQSRSNSGRISTVTNPEADTEVSLDMGIDRRDVSPPRLQKSAASGLGSPLSSPRSSWWQPSGALDLEACEARRASTPPAPTASAAPATGIEASPRSASREASAARRDGEPQPQRQPQGRRRHLPQMPQTLALLLFRNADRRHAGEAVLVARWPLPCMGDLLAACGRACRPIVGPAEALLTLDLLPLRSVEEVRAGGVYLLKGHEALAPPLLFFSHREPQRLASTASTPSLRALHEAKQAVAADREMNRVPSPMQFRSTLQSRGGSSGLVPLSPRMPAVGSPPWPSHGLPPSGKPPSTWEATDRLTSVMSWGGQCQPRRHYHFERWTPALQVGSID